MAWQLLFCIAILKASLTSQEMMDPFPTRVIEEVPIRDGKASATSFYSSTYTPEKAFKRNDPHGWLSHRTQHEFPVLIWYEFKKPFVPAEISFTSRPDNGNPNEGPTRYQFVGTNDKACTESSRWAILCEDLSNTAFSYRYETKYCMVKPQIEKSYTCLGLRILGNRNGGGLSAVSDIRMWKPVTMD